MTFWWTVILAKVSFNINCKSNSYKMNKNFSQELYLHLDICSSVMVASIKKGSALLVVFSNKDSRIIKVEFAILEYSFIQRDKVATTGK